MSATASEPRMKPMAAPNLRCWTGPGYLPVGLEERRGGSLSVSYTQMKQMKGGRSGSLTGRPEDPAPHRPPPHPAWRTIQTSSE